ncbi:ABC transporter permease [Lactococcus petauri]|uniref:ABC transporter permease n=1 Tax=Lactococcus petauri TaxID=1940789 RepID=UPI001BCEFD60|nr:iron export ABC transporter permease subunit FetB [Lactococcus petauri]MBS4460681.1 iron export ABC transporter permease subunit FetB [Lactococcus petauri]
MNNINVSNLSLFLALMLVLIAIFISSKERLGLSRDIIVSSVRTIIQLIFVGFVLKYVFQVDNAILTCIITLLIIVNASIQANKRNPNRHKQFIHSFVAIFLSTSITLLILILSGVIKFIPSQVIPISGMIASNSMVAIGLCYNNMNIQFIDQRQQVLEKLALGASIKRASLSILQQSIRTGIQPTIDSAKTVGLVSLPGMMSGLIFAGVDPVHAIKYQIMVMFMLLSATSIGTVIAGYFSYKNYYNNHSQLNF